MKKAYHFKKMTTAVLTALMMLSNIGAAPVYAEDTVPEEPTAAEEAGVEEGSKEAEPAKDEQEVVEVKEEAEPVAEAPQAEKEEETEQPAEGKAEEKPAEEVKEAEKEQPAEAQPSEPVEEKAEDAKPEEKAEETADKEEPVKAEEPEKEEDAEKSEEKALKVYVADDAADMLAAVATLGDDDEHRIVVKTNDDVASIVDQRGKAVLYDGTYIISFDDKGEVDNAVDVINNVADATVVKEERLEIMGGEDDEKPTEISDAISQETAASASEGLELSGNTRKPVVALIDTGANEYASVRVNLTSDGDGDSNGHGTNMAKNIMEAAGGNVEILSIKAFNDDGTASLSNIYAAVKYAMEANVDIINISAAMLDSENTAAVKELISEAAGKGIKIVVAAGNKSDETYKYFPANMDCVITVGAASEDGKLLASSNYGGPVDYYVIAQSTSYAAAKMSGYLATGNIERADVLRWLVPAAVVIHPSEYMDVNSEEYKRMQIAGLWDGAGVSLHSIHSWFLADEGVYLTNIRTPEGTFMCNQRGTSFQDGAMYYYAGPADGTLGLIAAWGYATGEGPGTNFERAQRAIWGQNTDAVYAEALAWAESQGGGSIHASPSFDSSSKEYKPGQEVVFRGNSDVSAYDYYVTDVSVSGGDDIHSSDVSAKISGNDLYVTVSEDAKEMPETITITVDTDHADEPGGWSCDSALFTSPSGSQAMLYIGAVTGTPGRTFDSTKVTLKLGIHGGYEIFKVDSSKRDPFGQGDATLAGAEFTIINSRNNRPVTKITTDANGHAATSASALKWGDYKVAETKAPQGYLLNDEYSDSFQLRVDGHMYSDKSHNASEYVADDVIRGGIKLVKHDSDFRDQVPQGDATLKGAEYGIYNISEMPIYMADGTKIENKGEGKTYEGHAYGPQNFVMTLVTDEHGEAQTAPDILPYGTYLVIEEKAPEGYLIEGTIGQIVEVREQGKIVSAENLFDDVIRGQLIVGKVDLERLESGLFDAEGVAVPQGDATLAGAEFTIYLKSPNHVMSYPDKTEHKTDEAVLTIISDELGIAKTAADALPYGSYYVKETKAPEGYLLNEDYRVDFEIREDGEVKDFTGTPEEKVADQIIRGGIELTKFDTDRYGTSHGDPNNSQGDATLEGAEYRIYNISKKDGLVDGSWVDPKTATNRAEAFAIDESALVLTMTTDAEGHWATGDHDLPYGTYLIKETKAPEGYMLNDSWYSIIEIREEGKIMNGVDDNKHIARQAWDGKAVDDVIRGGVKFQKADRERFEALAQGDATLAGAEITIYNVSGKEVFGINNQKDAAKAAKYDGSVGITNDYTWIETGEVVDTTVGPRDVDTLHYVNDGSGNVNTVVGANVQSGINASEAGKYAYKTDVPEPHAEQTPYDDALMFAGTQAAKAEPRSFEGAQPVVTIVTDENGVASLNGEALPYGTYYAIETKPSRGYMLNTEWIIHFEIREDGVVLDFSDTDPTSDLYDSARGHQLMEQIIRGDVRIYKEDLEMSELNGVKRENYNYKYDDSPVSAAYIDGQDNGYAATVLPASPVASNGYGYKLGTEAAHHAGVINGEEGELGYNSELNPSQAIGGSDHSARTASLNGIEFTITNISTLSILSDAGTLVEYQPGEYVTKIYTHYDGELDTNGDGVADSCGYIAETTDKALPYGTYSIQETATNASYMLTDGTPRIFEIEYDGEIADTDKQTHHLSNAGEELIFRNQIKRGDIEFVKSVASNNERLQSLWVLENTTSGEKHVLVTDPNGEYKSYEFAHSDKTNANDGLLEAILAGNYEKMIDLTAGLNDGSIVAYHGVWFGLGEDGDMAAVNDKLGTLPYGQYTLHEVRTNTNIGMTLQNFNFFVTKNSTINNQGVIEKDSAINLGTVLNWGISIKTHAHDKETGTNYGVTSGDSIIIDTVDYQGVEEFGEYKLKTYLVDYDSGEIVVNAEGKEVSVEQTVNLNKRSGKVDVELPVSGKELAGRKVVIFEELYDKEDNLVGGHMDLLDNEQTIVYPGIRTTLADTTKSTAEPEDGMRYLTDVVKYTGLKTGVTYTMTGTLMDKSTGEPLEGVEPVSVEFKPHTPDGEVKVVFEIPLSLIAGKTVVAFEKCEQDGKEIAIHYDIEDKDQTVENKEPSIKTQAYGASTSDKNVIMNGHVVVTDIVNYKDLQAGETYKLEGKLMNKADGKPVLDAEGKEVTASKEFVAEGESGAVAMVFEFEAGEMEGDALVVFEKLYYADALIASHEDIEDEDQTVGVVHVEMKTTATNAADRSKEIDASGWVEIEDVVEYSGLVGGDKYHLEGELHLVTEDGKDGGVYSDFFGEDAVAETDFIADESGSGKAIVTFEIDATTLKTGQKLVVFEKLFKYDVKIDGDTREFGEDTELIITHEDINDEGQTVIVKTNDFPSESKLRTTAKIGEGKSIVEGNKATIIDTVEYEGLRTRVDYTLVGELHIKADGQDGPAIAKKEMTFRADKIDGSVELAFDEFDISKYPAGTKFVVYEFVYADVYKRDEGGNKVKDEDGNFVKEKTVIAEHADINDEGQTVEITPDTIKIGTKATVDGGKSVAVGKKAVIVDSVEMKGLGFDKDYVLKAELHIVKDGKDGGAVAVIEKAAEFHNDKVKDRTVEIKFSEFDLTKYPKGTKFVVFEYLFEKVEKEDETGKKIEELVPVAEHADINDKNQTVEITDKPDKPTPTPTPTPTPKPTPTPTPNQDTPRRSFERTGAGYGIYAAVAVVLLAGAAYILISKKRKHE